MGDRSNIEWTDATWNPVTGCTKVSPGCDHCYAETLAERFRGTPGHYYEQGFDVVLRPDKLDQPLRWTKPRMVFVNSMSDLFHDEIPDEYIARVFAVMAAASRHTFQLLTKRHARMRALLNSYEFVELVRTTPLVPGGDPNPHVPWPLPNLWLGVSTEDQKWADIRIPFLLATPAAVRWISAEPLLGPIDLDRPACDAHGRRKVVTDAHGREWCGFCADDGFSGELSFGHWLNPLNGGLQWVVTGGESGRGARPLHPDWVRSMRDQCAAQEVPFLHKQNGAYVPVVGEPRPGDVWVHGDGHGATPWTPDTAGAPAGRWSAAADVLVRPVNKRDAGRELDGKTYDGYPVVDDTEEAHA